jgi:hypothetical protein
MIAIEYVQLSVTLARKSYAVLDRYNVVSPAMHDRYR